MDAVAVNDPGTKRSYHPSLPNLRVSQLSTVLQSHPLHKLVLASNRQLLKEVLAISLRGLGTLRSN